MKQNPFVFGKIVKGNQFCNRKKEIERILSLVRSRNSIIIASPRRYGKTSLIINALEKGSIPHVFVDCSGVESREYLLEKIITAYTKRLKEGNALEFLKSLSKEIDLEYTVSISGFSVKVRKYSRENLEKLIREIAERNVIVFDEFQELFEMDEKLASELRSILQHINQSFIFLGSKKHLLLHLFMNQKSPFYKFGELLLLEKIDNHAWKAFIKKWFEKTSVMISDYEMDTILDLSEAIPFYVQYLCYYVWEGKRGNKTLEEVVDGLLHQNSYIYEEIIQKLPLLQRKALIIVANKLQPFSSKTLKKLGINTSQALNRAFQLLDEKGLIERNGTYRFVDPIFGRYVKLALSNLKV